MEDKKLYVELPRFTGRNVPISEVAEAMHKDIQVWICHEEREFQ